MPRIPSRTGIRSPEGAGLFDPVAAATPGKPDEIDKTKSDISIKSQVQNWGARSRVPASDLFKSSTGLCHDPGDQAEHGAGEGSRTLTWDLEGPNSTS
jgi:hypothetical protein